MAKKKVKAKSKTPNKEEAKLMLEREKEMHRIWESNLEVMKRHNKSTEYEEIPYQVGRPTNYKPIFCEMLIEHGKQGLSFESFGAIVGVCHATLYNWCNQHKQFMDAKKVAMEYSRIQWEKIGLKGAMGKLPNFNASAYKFNMKNRFKWTDRIDFTSGDKPVAPPPQLIIELPSNGREIDED